MKFTDEPLEPFGEVLLDISVEAQLGYKTPLVYRAIKTLQRHGCLPPYGCELAEVCLEEALANAMVHGNKLDPTKPVRLLVFADERRFGILVEDQGAGFKQQDVPDPNDPQTLYLERGRGILLMDSYMESVRYNRTGNRVCMTRSRQTQPDAGARPPRVLQTVAIPDDDVIEAVELARSTAPKAKPLPIAIPDEIELDLPVAEPVVESDDGPVRVTRHGDLAVAVIVDSRVTEDNAHEIRAKLIDIAANVRGMALDLSAVGFMSSIGISTIMAAHKQLMQSKAKLVLCAVQPAVVNIFKATGLTKLFAMEPTSEAALAKLGA